MLGVDRILDMTRTMVNVSSDLTATAYVAKSFWVLMAATPDVRNLEDPIERAHQVLSRRQRSNGGWAYSAQAPTDAEATAWALWSLLDEPRRRLYSTGRGRRYLSAHRDPDSGGFVIPDVSRAALAKKRRLSTAKGMSPPRLTN